MRVTTGEQACQVTNMAEAAGFREYKLDGRVVTREEFLAAGGSETSSIIEPPQRSAFDTIAEEQHEEMARVQSFFAKLAADVRGPACGDQHRATINDVLRQAQAAGLYEPPTEQT